MALERNMKKNRLQKHLDNLVAIAVDWGADQYLSDGKKTLEGDIENEIERLLETEYQHINSSLMKMGESDESN